MDRTYAHPDGLVAYVKRACPTCTMLEPQMQRVARSMPQFQIVSQDDPAFPAGLAGVIDDRELDRSYVANIEYTPTLIRYEKGQEAERVVGWDRDDWRRLTGISDLGFDLPAQRPG
jgi:hypothetical protein